MQRMTKTLYIITGPPGAEVGLGGLTELGPELVGGTERRIDGVAERA